MARTTKEPNLEAVPSLSVFAGNGSYALPRYLVDWEASLQGLADPFDPTDLYFLPQSVKDGSAEAMVYANSRVYTERMDAVIGAGFWQSEVVRVDTAEFAKTIKDWNNKDAQGNAKTSTATGFQVGAVVRIGVWMGSTLGWVWQDSTGSSETSDPNWITTAEAQAYKRAMSKWGPGRYFYSFPKQRCKYTKTNGWSEQPYIPDWAYPVKLCTDCNQPITAIQYKDNGQVLTLAAWDVFEKSKLTYGIPICANCSRIRRNANSTAGADQRLQAA